MSRTLKELQELIQNETEFKRIEAIKQATLGFVDSPYPMKELGLELATAFKQHGELLVDAIMQEAARDIASKKKEICKELYEFDGIPIKNVHYGKPTLQEIIDVRKTLDVNRYKLIAGSFFLSLCA
ncbi:hypothetical protein [Vibrio sp. D431a]|uniref:hypothetical protein n=1 Tax=Vibrio sp. D431a TaxID=2837388 RepID=UPI002552AE0B|nr:hypothetical protein [Vibrio sp. D431a]MDK9793340.1 hypothetical protein [Vibrio sp. D431a]